MKMLNRKLRTRELPEKVFNFSLKILRALYLFENSLPNETQAGERKNGNAVVQSRVTKSKHGG